MFLQATMHSLWSNFEGEHLKQPVPINRETKVPRVFIFSADMQLTCALSAQPLLLVITMYVYVWLL